MPIPYYCPRGASPQERLDYWSIPEALTGCTLCWLSPIKDGYRKLQIGNVSVQAHRLAYILANGPIQEGVLVLHRCDTPACVNPLHLRLGDNAANTADKISRGRLNALVGERQGRAKLTDQTAMEVFLSPAPYDDIADATASPTHWFMPLSVSLFGSIFTLCLLPSRHLNQINPAPRSPTHTWTNRGSSQGYRNHLCRPRFLPSYFCK